MFNNKGINLVKPTNIGSLSFFSVMYTLKKPFHHPQCILEVVSHHVKLSCADLLNFDQFSCCHIYYLVIIKTKPYHSVKNTTYFAKL